MFPWLKQTFLAEGRLRAELKDCLRRRQCTAQRHKKSCVPLTMSKNSGSSSLEISSRTPKVAKKERSLRGWSELLNLGLPPSCKIHGSLRCRSKKSAKANWE